MKVAILFFGLSYYENYNRRNKIIDIDWKRFKHYIQNFLLNDLQKHSIQYDTFLVSNKSNPEEEKKLLNFYKPKKYKFYNINDYNENIETNEKSYESRNRKMLYGLEMIKNYNDTYNSIIALRFDLIFKNQFTNYNIIWSKFNFHYLQFDMVDDNLFVFNQKYLNYFIEFLKKNINKRGHDFLNLINIPEQEINFLAKKENKHKFFSLPNYYGKI